MYMQRWDFSSEKVKSCTCSGGDIHIDNNSCDGAARLYLSLVLLC